MFVGVLKIEIRTLGFCCRVKIYDSSADSYGSEKVINHWI